MATIDIPTCDNCSAILTSAMKDADPDVLEVWVEHDEADMVDVNGTPVPRSYVYLAYTDRVVKTEAEPHDMARTVRGVPGTVTLMPPTKKAVN